MNPEEAVERLNRLADQDFLEGMEYKAIQLGIEALERLGKLRQEAIGFNALWVAVNESLPSEREE